MFNQGDLVAYINGNTVEIGKIKSIINDKAFVYYHTGDTAARTSLSDLKLISNAYCIKEPFLGQSQIEPCEWCIRTIENIPKNYCPNCGRKL